MSRTIVLLPRAVRWPAVLDGGAALCLQSAGTVKTIFGAYEWIVG